MSSEAGTKNTTAAGCSLQQPQNGRPSSRSGPNGRSLRRPPGQESNKPSCRRSPALAARSAIDRAVKPQSSEHVTNSAGSAIKPMDKQTKHSADVAKSSAEDPSTASSASTTASSDDTTNAQTVQIASHANNKEDTVIRTLSQPPTSTSVACREARPARLPVRI